jgi:kynurenine formamidase
MEIKDVLEMGRRLRNWGRWGPEDELGTLNFITPEKIVEACRLVKRGKAFALAIPFDSRGPQTGGGGRINPLHVMLATGADAAVGAQDRIPGGFRYADDLVIMPLQCATQWDALAHVFYDDQMYNGYDVRLVTAFGARRNSIDKMKDRIVSRGVLLDIPRHKGLDWLEPGYPITPEDLDGAAGRQGVAVGTGDILLVRTGHMALCRSRGNWEGFAGGDAPGLALSTAPWLHEKQVAGVATDTWGVEVRPNEPPNTFQPLHMVLIRDMGLLLGEIFYLDELAEDCAADGAYEFLLVAPPIPFTGAVGSPVNPIALK